MFLLGDFNHPSSNFESLLSTLHFHVMDKKGVPTGKVRMDDIRDPIDLIFYAGDVEPIGKSIRAEWTGDGFSFSQCLRWGIVTTSAGRSVFFFFSSSRGVPCL